MSSRDWNLIPALVFSAIYIKGYPIGTGRCWQALATMVAILTSKISVYGTRFTWWHCIHKKLLFGGYLGRQRHWSVFLRKRRWWGHTVNDKRYKSMITNFFWPKLNDMDVDDMWFQQKGATCCTANATMDILHERFEDMVISRGGDVNWPPRSWDLTLIAIDFFLWGFLKSQVYANKPQ